MKKRNLKALKLQKKSISSLATSEMLQGGIKSYRSLCDTDYFCDTWASCEPFKLSDYCHQP